MRDQDKTKEELLRDVAELRRGSARLKAEITRLKTPDPGPAKGAAGRKRTPKPATPAKPDFRKLYEDAKRREEISRSLFNASPDPMVVYDIQGVPTFINNAFTRVFGWTFDEIRGKRIDFVPSEYQAETQAMIAMGLRGEYLSDIETKRSTKDGRIVDVSVSGAFFFDSQGKPAGAVVRLRDITFRKQAQEKIRKSEEKYRTIIETIEDGYYEVDLQGNFVFFNDPLCEIFACTRQELAGANYRSFMDKDNVRKILLTFKEVLKTGKSRKLFDYEIIRADRARRSMSISVALVKDAAGVPCGFRGICRDITERMQAEATLASDLKKFEALYDLALGMTEEGNLKQNLSLAVEKSRELLATDTAYIALHDKESGELYMSTLSGIRTEAFKAIRLPFGGGLGGKVAATGKGFVIEDYFQEIEPLLHDVVRREGLISGIAVPLQIGQTLLGVLYAFNRTQTAFSKSDLDTLCLLGNLAAVEIARTQADQNLQEAYGHLERRVTERTTELHETNEKLLLEIGDRRRAEQALHESEERYRQLVDKADDLIAACDTNGLITFVNPVGLRIIGYSEEEVLGKSYFELIHPEHRDAAREFFGSQFGKREYETYREFPLVTKHGNDLWLGLKVQALLEGDRITAFQGIGRDVTERKKAEDGLRNSEERYRQLYEESKKREELYVSLLNSSADAVVIYDMQGRAKYVNPSFSRIFGWTGEEVQGKRIPFLPDSERAATMAVIRGLTRDGTPCSAFESRRSTKHGELVDVSISASTYRDHEGKPEGILAILRDVTRRKRSEQKLEDALATAIQLRVQAEAANRAKSEFLANMSHELRTPLNAIIGFSEILEDQSFGPLNRKQVHYVRHVLDSGRHLLRLISDILDLAKVESGKMEMSLSPVNVRHLLLDSVALFKAQALQETLSLTQQISSSLEDLSIEADEIKLRQILFNLLSNAIKFTPSGGEISLNASRDGNELRISVSDTGIGLKPEDCERIFGAFEQVDATYSRHQNGTGLGLALTRRLVQLHHGRIWAESPGEGQGSTFTFVIPLVHDLKTCEENHM